MSRCFLQSQSFQAQWLLYVPFGLLLKAWILPTHCMCMSIRIINEYFPSERYVLVNKTDLVHNLFLVYLSISTCFGRLCAHHQEEQLCLCDTWYLLFCVDNCLVCTLRENNKYQVSHKHSCSPWWCAQSRPKQVEIDKYTKNKLCFKLVSFTSVYRGARSTEHKMKYIYWILGFLCEGNSCFKELFYVWSFCWRGRSALSVGSYAQQVCFIIQ